MKFYFNRNTIVSNQLYLFPILVLFTCFFSFKSNAQNPINYVEYYMDQDPGIGKATPVSVTVGVNINNASFNIDVSTIKTGIHIVGSRARTSNGVWGMTHYWFVFKPYPIISPAAADNIVKVEYFVDSDPGYGKGTAATITPGTNLENVVFNINPSLYSKGTHIIGVRAQTASNNWSHTNYWLFYNAFELTPQAPALSNINYVEYYVNVDPGFGKGIPVSITSSNDISNTAFNAAIDTVKAGTNLIGVRGRSANGAWSYTNYLMFVKPFNNTPIPAAPGNITNMEYFLDYDPGIGKAKSITITPGTNLADLNFNVDLTNIIPGNHSVSVRAKDANGNWSLVNSWPFTIPGTPAPFTTTFTPTNICVSDSIQVGYSAKGIVFNSDNKFIVQLSDPGGTTFNNPTIIGEIAGTQDTGILKVLIPSNIPATTYRLRVISTNQSIVSSNNGSNFTINGLPAAPVISPSRDTAICTGRSITLNSNVGGTLEWYLNGNKINNATSSSYAANAAGRYTLRLISSVGCKSDSSKGVAIILIAPPTQPTITTSKSPNICTGDSVVLTSSATSANKWYLNGSLISSATQNTLVVKSAGVYTVEVTNAAGCTATSANTTVTVNSFPSTPIISNSRPLSFLVGDSTVLTSSASTGNQWFLNGSAIAGATGTSIVVKTAGTYSVQVTNASGCSVVSSNTIVTVNTAPIPVISNSRPLTFCAGDSTVLTSSIATGNQWLLDGNTISGATGATYTVKTSGSYTVRNNNQVSTAVVVTANSLPAVPTISSSGPLTFNNGDSTILTSSASTGNQWLLNGSNIAGATGTTIIVKTAGTYSVRVTNASGCSIVSSNTVVTVNAATPIPVISNNRPLTFCVGDSTVLTSSISTGNQWLLNGNAISGATAANYTVKTSGSYTVRNNNQVSAAVVVTANSLPAVPTISSSGPLTFNNGDSTILTSSASTGNQWLLNGSNIAGATGVSIIVKTSGTYSVRVTNASGCTVVSSNTVVTVNAATPIPVISNNRPLTFCVGDSTVLTSSIATGNQWLLNGNAISGATAANYTVKTSGSYTVRNNNQVSAAVVVTANSLPAVPTISSSGPLTFNNGDSTILTSSASTGNQWLLNESAIAGATGTTIVVKTAGTYSVRVTNASGCSVVSSNTVVTVNSAGPVPVISNNRPLTFCVGDSTVLTSSIATGNQWLLNGNAITGATSSTYTVKTSGSYTVRNNNQVSAAVVVTANSIPAKPTISRDVVNNLVSSSSTGNQWYTDTTSIIAGATQQSYKPVSVGYYSVKVTQNGCTSNFADKYYYLVTALTTLVTNTEIKLYPNPAKNQLTLTHQLLGVSNLNIEILDINGKSTMVKKGIRTGNQIDISSLPNGIYYMKCTSPSIKQEYLIKFMKL